MNCNVKIIESENISSKSKVVVICIGSQENRSISTFVEFVLKGTMVVVLFLFKYFLSVIKLYKIFLI